jgi:DNA topoisomerase-3
MNCPFCGNAVKKILRGWVCTEYDNGCKFSVLAEIAGKKITQSQVAMLTTSGRTVVIKGFVANGKTFDAALKLNIAAQKIEFDFTKK